MRTFEQNCMETDNYLVWHGASKTHVLRNRSRAGGRR